MSKDFTDGTVETLSEYVLTAVVSENDGITLDDAKVISTDISAVNGVIHVLDKVIIPTTPPPDGDGDESTGMGIQSTPPAKTHAQLCCTTNSCAEKEGCEYWWRILCCFDCGSVELVYVGFGGLFLKYRCWGCRWSATPDECAAIS